MEKAQSGGEPGEQAQQAGDVSAQSVPLASQNEDPSTGSMPDGPASFSRSTTPQPTAYAQEQAVRRPSADASAGGAPSENASASTDVLPAFVGAAPEAQDPPATVALTAQQQQEQVLLLRASSKETAARKRPTKLGDSEMDDGEANHSEASSGSDEEDSGKGRSTSRDMREHDMAEVVEEHSPKGRFVRFNRKLGAGSYKTVYLGFDNDTGREVAWNMISFQNMQKHERKRITEEISMLKMLKHPRILSFINAWINKKDEQVCFITERVTGGSLRMYIKRIDAALKRKVVRNWSRQILEGLEYLHKQEPGPVIHRDLKCDNIFINGSVGEVLIGDLGLSTSLKAQSCAASIVGTPEFMAPELYEEKYGVEVDIYAFGMCLLEMVSRGSPYSECSSPGQIYKKVIAGEKPRVLKRVKDNQLRDLVEKCTGLDPHERPSAAECLQDIWLCEVRGEDGNELCELKADEEVSDIGVDSPVRQYQPAAPNLPAIPEGAELNSRGGVSRGRSQNSSHLTDNSDPDSVKGGVQALSPLADSAPAFPEASPPVSEATSDARPIAPADESSTAPVASGDSREVARTVPTGVPSLPTPVEDGVRGDPLVPPCRSSVVEDAPKVPLDMPVPRDRRDSNPVATGEGSSFTMSVSEAQGRLSPEGLTVPTLDATNFASTSRESQAIDPEDSNAVRSGEHGGVSPLAVVVTPSDAGRQPALGNAADEAAPTSAPFAASLNGACGSAAGQHLLICRGEPEKGSEGFRTPREETDSSRTSLASQAWRGSPRLSHRDPYGPSTSKPHRTGFPARTGGTRERFYLNSTRIARCCRTCESDGF